MFCKCSNSFIGQLETNKIYEILDINGRYIYIKLDSGRYSWEYIGNFIEITGSIDTNRKRYYFKDIEFL